MRINNTSEDAASYDTHLIIALNEEAYTLLVNFNVNDVAIPKHAFKTARRRPTIYGVDLPATFIQPGYVDVSVSVSSSNAINVRIHFDVYGSKVPPPPSSIGEITHAPRTKL